MASHEEPVLTGMDSFKYELKQMFCTPTARCYKGLSILFGIWCAACILIATLITPVIKAHGDNVENHNVKPDEPTAADVQARMRTMKVWTILLTLVFAALSILSTCVFLGLKKKSTGEEGHSLVED